MAVRESLKVPARVWKQALAGILAFHSGARLSRLNMPTLIVGGDRDEIAPPDDQERLHRAIQGSKRLCYEDTGHAPHWEQPRRFVEDCWRSSEQRASALRGNG